VKKAWGFWVKKPYNLYAGLKKLAKINNKEEKLKNWYIMKINNTK